MLLGISPLGNMWGRRGPVRTQRASFRKPRCLMPASNREAMGEVYYKELGTLLQKKSRHDYLHMGKKQSDTSKERPLTFVTMFSTRFDDTKKVVNRYLPILYQDRALDNILWDGVKFVARKVRSLGNIVLPSAPPSSKQTTWLTCTGFFKCGHGRCGVCRFVNQTKTFCANHNPQQQRIGSFLNCSTDHVIYLVTCTACNVQYIGCTVRKLRVRIYVHIQGVQVGLDSLRNISSVSRHFRDCHHGELSSLRVMEIEHVFSPRRD